MTTFIHDLIKIKYVEQGYLQNYPPHLIADEEMCDAFLKYPVDDTKTEDELWGMFLDDTTPMWFKDNYPLLNPLLEPIYRELVQNIVYHISEFKASLDDVRILPDWVYSYMMNTVISTNSDIRDIHDLLVMLGVDNIDDIFTPEAQVECYLISKDWLAKTPGVTLGHRSPTIFGEPHVIKSLRLSSLNMLGNYYAEQQRIEREKQRKELLEYLKSIGEVVD